MSATLLAISQQASREMGISAPATIVSNSAQYAVSLLNLVNGVGQQLVTEHPWQGIDIEYRFTTTYYQYTATTTDGSTTISSMSSTTGLTTSPTYFAVTGTGIETDTALVSVNAGAATAVLTRAATASGTVTLTFAQIRYAFPTDFDRLVDRTDWDKSQNWPIYGPETGQQWQYLKSGFIASSPIYRFRQLGSLFQIWPPLAANDYAGFEYISSYWVAATGTTTLSKTAYAVDTDTAVFPDRLMIAGLKYRFAESQGMERAKAYAVEWQRQLNIAKAADAGSPTLSLAPRPAVALVNYQNIPDSGYGT